MNRKNINMSLAEATRVSCETLRAARTRGLATRGYLAVAFECPFEGTTPPERVLELGLALLEAGADEIVVADTIGAASPAQVQQLLGRLLLQLPVDRLGLHLHDTRGMGVANAYAGLELGVRRFDASAGGLGGCPFAPGASGNVATEDLVLMLEQSGFATGISLPGLASAVDLAASCSAARSAATACRGCAASSPLAASRAARAAASRRPLGRLPSKPSSVAIDSARSRASTLSHTACACCSEKCSVALARNLSRTSSFSAAARRGRG
jgi:isopropylmalate/homocitrate/citramalate synthase